MPNDFKQCKLCDKIYKYAGSSFCPNCIREVDKYFRTVKDFLYKNPDSTVTQVMAESKVDERIILYFLREGRLEIRDAGEFLKCEKCGASITTGRLCNKCSGELSAAFERVIQQKPAADVQTQKKMEVNLNRKNANCIEKNNRR